MRKKIAAFMGTMLLSAGLCAGCSKGTPTQVPEQNQGITVTLAPTEQPKEDPTSTPTLIPTQVPMPTQVPDLTLVPTELPTEAPVPAEAVAAPFAMVSPVPQSAVTDIVGTMTIDTYPVVDGSTATLPLSEAVFMAATGESTETAAKQVVHTKTTNSYHRLYNKEVDLLIVYEPAESIVERMKEEPLCIKPIGLDALVFLANQANPVESLTMEQLVEIYSGKVTDWSEVGGQDKDLLAFQRPVGSGSQTLMQKLVMGDVEMMSGDNVFRYNTMSDILEGMLSYNNEDNTLGYSVFYYANNMYFEKDLKLMGVDGVLPSTQTIYDGSYKLTNAFYAVIRTDEPEDSNARKIFDWLTGEAGQQLVLDLGYVPVQMPEGADISKVQTEKKETVEVLAKEPLEEGQYFVFFNPQNVVYDYYYGDMTVYNHKWEEVASFYNVTLNHSIQGIHTQRYLPVGQIRQNAEGKQVVRYGIFDLEQGEYSVVPTYTNMEVLDEDRGYYAVPQNEESWMDYMVINGTGEVLLGHVIREDWMTIGKFGNGYREMVMDYSNWENGYTYRYYDENLQLKKVLCEQAAALPPMEEWEEGVDYIYLEGQGCLLDENGEVLINAPMFLSRYGDGEDFNCQLSLDMVTEETDREVYGILYQNKVYLVERNLELVRLVDNASIVENFQNAEFFREFCYYYDEEEADWAYRTYEGSPLRMRDGGIPDGVEFNWVNDNYLLYRRDEAGLYAEEYTGDEAPAVYEIPLKTDDSYIELSYEGSGYLQVCENTEEYLEYPESGYPSTPLKEIALYYKGERVSVKNGAYGYMMSVGDGYEVWYVFRGEYRYLDSESLFEETETALSCGDYTLTKDGRELYEITDAYLTAYGNDAMLFLCGNYVYAVGADGTAYIRALHNMMSTD